jgi:hypothetical protein
MGPVGARPGIQNQFPAKATVLEKCQGHQPHAGYQSLSRVQEEASNDGQHFLAYLIGLAMAHLRAVGSAQPAHLERDP